VALPPESPGHNNGAGAGVDIGTRVRVQDPGGAFTVEPLAAGTYDLVLTAADGRSGRLAAVTVAAGQQQRGLRIVVGASVTIRGRVVDDETGRGLPGVEIGVRGTRYLPGVRTDDDGRFALEGQVSGRTLALDVRPPQPYIQEKREVTLPPGQPVVETAPLQLVRQPPVVAGERAGVGLKASEREGPAVVATVTPGSAADQAGLRPGDLLLSIDGRAVMAYGPRTIAALLAGPAHSHVELSVTGPAGARRSLTLERTDGASGGQGSTLRVTSF
jgi:hypothetical protein